MERRNRKVAPVVVDKPVVVAAPVKLLWRKVGGGHLVFQNKMIKPGETFYAHEADLPKAFKDSLVCIEPAKQEQIQIELKQLQKEQGVKFDLKESEESGKFDVVNEYGKAINENPLAEEVAVELKENLES